LFLFIKKNLNNISLSTHLPPPPLKSVSPHYIKKFVVFVVVVVVAKTQNNRKRETKKKEPNNKNINKITATNKQTMPKMPLPLNEKIK
jgi:CRISPR/Cas system-associated protein endoribonuclease Cas2